MKIRAKVYVDKNGDGLLHPIDSGEVIAYSPISSSGDGYVSFVIGDFHLNMNFEDFSKYCKHFLNFSLYNKKGNKHAILRPSE